MRSSSYSVRNSHGCSSEHWITTVYRRLHCSTSYAVTVWLIHRCSLLIWPTAPTVLYWIVPFYRALFCSLFDLWPPYLPSPLPSILKYLDDSSLKYFYMKTIPPFIHIPVFPFSVLYFSLSYSILSFFPLSTSNPLPLFPPSLTWVPLHSYSLLMTDNLECLFAIWCWRDGKTRRK